MEILYDYDSLYDEVKGLDFELENLVEEVISATLKYENINFNIEVSITLVDNEEIQELNLKHRKKDYATDVLSFPMYTSFEDFNDGDTALLGDIVISLEKAKEQAKSYNHSVKREVGFLVAHSMLHLLGYDHLEEVEEKIMIKKQEDILNTINLKR